MTNQITLPNSSTFFVEQNIHFPQWLNSVNYHRQCFANNDAVTWLLYCDNAYQFSVLFFGLLTANKKIILPQNGTVNQLQLCMELADGFAGAAELIPTLAADNVVSYCPQSTLPIASPLRIASNTDITLFTSGSTGDAKAINKTFQHLLNEIMQLEHCFGDKLGNATIVSTVSHQHIYGLLFKLMWPIWFSRDVLLQPYEYPEHLCYDHHKYKLKNIAIVSSPPHYHRLIKDNVYMEMRDNISTLFSSGGPLSDDASRQLAVQLGQSPNEIYGSTETGGIAWRQRCLGQSNRWLPFGDIELSCQNTSQCLMLKSPYFDHDGWYITDDQIKIAADGSFDLLGRVDRIIKIEEKRVSLDHVQHCLKALDFIDDAFCLTLLTKRGLQIVAAVVLTEEAQNELDQSRNLVFNRRIKSHLMNDLEVIAIPKKFRYLPALPYNSSGKLNKLVMEKVFE
ncbi:AMP-binding protein [Colwellia sp. MSW7]|uniref:AMP-binding protein n=1 Tax=Colwellia maritima TaxID=2912588 RepID=A0ABS9WXM2_9GAMM|nr:AMP-binding protein [Colwellia maritima]MCI2282609.1 AMP-binding protein [Colwellia maritima]